MEVLKWEREGFQGRSFGCSNAFGKDEIRQTFAHERYQGRDRNKLAGVILFLASRMNTEGAAQLCAHLIQEVGVNPMPISPTGAGTTPVGVLKEVLGGGYDKRIGETSVAPRDDVYTLALFFYMSLGRPEEEVAEVMCRLLLTFDDPERSIYMVDLEGLLACPYLAHLCKKSIARHQLQDAVRSEVRERMKALPDLMAKTIARGNAHVAGVGWKGPIE